MLDVERLKFPTFYISHSTFNNPSLTSPTAGPEFIEGFSLVSEANGW